MTLVVAWSMVHIEYLKVSSWKQQCFMMLPFQQNDDSWQETRPSRAGDGGGYLVGGQPPTLTQVNTNGSSSRSSKRPKRDPPHSHSHSYSVSYSYHQSSSSDEDYSHSGFIQRPSTMEQHPSRTFDHEGCNYSGDDGEDQLSSSFRSLYKSIFGHSVCSGEYLNPPPLPPSSLTELGSSDSSIPLGASALSLLDATGITYGHQFSMLMDSFRDIAETNGWDKLQPTQVQGLVMSFRAAERDQFGLDAESFSRVSSSFEQFFQQLNSRVCCSSSRRGDHHQAASELGDYQPNIPGTGDSAAQPLVDALPLTYPENPTMFPISGASPPSSNYLPPSLHIDPPSPPPPLTNEMMTHISPQEHAHHLTSDPTLTSGQFSSAPSERAQANESMFSIAPVTSMAAYLQETNSTVRSQGQPHSEGTHQHKSTAPHHHRDPFDNDEEDDFDWSTIM